MHTYEVSRRSFGAMGAVLERSSGRGKKDIDRVGQASRGGRERSVLRHAVRPRTAAAVCEGSITAVIAGYSSTACSILRPRQGEGRVIF